MATDLLEGVPRYQVFAAARLGITNPTDVIQWLTANSDQPDEFYGVRTALASPGTNERPMHAQQHQHESHHSRLMGQTPMPAPQ
jgi:hypothetical protein